MATQKTHTTNFTNTFIKVAADCPVQLAKIPQIKKDIQTVANIQFEMVAHNPYKYTSDEVIFQVFATKNKITGTALQLEKEMFFSKGQACFRCSPLTKRYGWGLHCNENGKIALYALESEEYKKLSKDENLTIVKAMRTTKIK